MVVRNRRDSCDNNYFHSWIYIRQMVAHDSKLSRSSKTIWSFCYSKSRSSFVAQGSNSGSFQNNYFLFQRNIQTRATRDAKETEDESLENLIGASVRNSALSHMRPSTIQKLERNSIWIAKTHKYSKIIYFKIDYFKSGTETMTLKFESHKVDRQVSFIPWNKTYCIKL